MNGSLCLRLSCVLVALASAGGVSASPYRVTSLGAADTWELKLETEYSHSNSSSVVEGAFDITAPLLPGLETSLTFGGGRLESDAFPTQRGWLDSEVAVKWEIMPLGESGGFGITTEPALIVPTSTNGLGDHQWKIEVPLIVGYQKGAVQIRGLLGYAHSLETDEDEIPYGVVTEFAVSDKLALGAEVVGSTVSRDIFKEYEAEANIGFSWEFTDGVELQGRLGHSLQNRNHERERHGALFIEFAL